MKRIVKCCLAVVLGLALAGCSEGSSGGSGGGGFGKLREHKGVQLWKDGPYWAETNIGAENPWDYGYYFWWGDTIGYKRVKDAWVASDGSSRNFKFDEGNTLTDSKSVYELKSKGWITEDGVLAPEHDAAHVHWGGDWRMPTRQDLEDLVKKCDWTWVIMNGVEGCVVQGRGKYASASIFLPCAGYGRGTSLNCDGSDGLSHGNYQSSVPSGSYDDAWDLCFISPCHETGISRRYDGQPVRPVQGGCGVVDSIVQGYLRECGN